MNTPRLFAFFFVSAFFMSILFASGARAEHISPDGRLWADRIRAAQNLSLAAIDPNRDPLTVDDRRQIETIADDQAQAWADTILEGDYLAENALQIERIETAMSGGDFVGYRVTYSSSAYDTSDCDAQNDVRACTPGRIVESTLIAPTLDSWLRDRNGYAEFIPNDLNR